MFYIIRVAMGGAQTPVMKRKPNGDIEEASWYQRQSAEAAALAMKKAERLCNFIVVEKY